VLQARPRFAVDRERHRALMRGFFAAARSADTNQLVALLAEDVVFHGDGGGKATANKQPIAGNVAVAQFVIAVTATLPPEAVVEEIDLNGAPGLVARLHGRALVAQAVEAEPGRDGGQIGLERAHRLIRRRAVEPQESVLHDVFSLCPAAGDPVGEPEHRGPQLGERLVEAHAGCISRIALFACCHDTRFRPGQ